MSEICVVHLIRAKNGVQPFQQFLESYRNNPAGINHDLLIIYKGFSFGRGIEEYQHLLKDHPHHSLFITDWGFDIRPYFIAARKFNYKYFCFLNSFSRILDRDWLAKLYRYISDTNVGLAGATGSYQSISSDAVNVCNTEKTLFKSIMSPLWRMIVMRLFDPFPNYHIRSNAFIISGDLIRRLHYRSPCIKLEAWMLESGKKSITKQVLQMKKRVLVVGRDGRAYEKEDWPRSNTFWQGEEGNLLIADNQTMKYLHGDIATRRSLTQYAWGSNLIK